MWRSPVETNVDRVAKDRFCPKAPKNTCCGSDLSAVRAQFQAICEMIDAGGMVRHGIIMLGYHNRVFSGDVLLVDGEVIGEWTSDDEEWCHFTAVDTVVATRSAPSPWMLHDTIANWVECADGIKEA